MRYNFMAQDESWTVSGANHDVVVVKRISKVNQRHGMPIHLFGDLLRFLERSVGYSDGLNLSRAHVLANTANRVACS